MVSRDALYSCTAPVTTKVPLFCKAVEEYGLPHRVFGGENIKVWGISLYAIWYT